MYVHMHVVTLCCRDIVDLHAIQTDIAELVNDQGNEIDRIGELVAPVLSHTVCTYSSFV